MNTLSRRRFLLSAGMVGSLCLAGCSGALSQSDSSVTGIEHSGCLLSYAEAWSCKLHGYADLGRTETTNLVVQDGCVFVGDKDELVKVDACSGMELGRATFVASADASLLGNAIELAVQDKLLIALLSSGHICAINKDDLSQIWVNQVVSLADFQSSHAARVELLASRPVIHSGCVYALFSSYELTERTCLVACNLSDGGIKWKRMMQGRSCRAGGIGYPLTTNGGLVLPAPDGFGFLLLDYGTGAERSRIVTEHEVRMGLTRKADDSDTLFSQEYDGTIWRISVEGKKLQGFSKPLATNALFLGNGARPVLCDGALYANIPKFDGNGEIESSVFEHGEIAVLEPNTLELLDKRWGRVFESTPHAIGRNMVYLSRNGLIEFTSDFNGSGSFSRLSKDVTRVRSLWDQPLEHADGYFYALTIDESLDVLIRAFEIV